ncbi:hypothetical protein NOF55_12450 [Rhizobiaceae bacterium BDR2-2]|uniref:Uncharacterized protein n=1 Tax=Ectorhizobium quercum TaxID=2965071 RepID=A0AAE3SV82_9HYPH|nr:hypothetical protein [Ectorhizobium quercum]MCX8997912.1 hypothetical protein [Ectorhizobium quercum]
MSPIYRTNLEMSLFLISYRLRSQPPFDIARMDRIVEEGRPGEPGARDGLFARLWKRQTGGFMAAEIGGPNAFPSRASTSSFGAGPQEREGWPCPASAL